MTKLAAVIAILLATAGVYADDPPLISGQITVFGSRITVSPSFIETPAGIPVFINTTGNGIAGILKGELRGPTISGALTFETVPGQPFQPPGPLTIGRSMNRTADLVVAISKVTLAKQAFAPPNFDRDFVEAVKKGWIHEERGIHCPCG